MSPAGLVFFLGLFLVGKEAGAATVRAEGKSVEIRVESKDRTEASRVATASAAATDLFDELTLTRLNPPLEIRGRLVAGVGPSPVLEWDSQRKYRLQADPGSKDFTTAWVSAVISARILAAAEKRKGSGSIRWLAEGCTGRAVPGDEAMKERVAARAGGLGEASLSRIQGWPDQGVLAGDSLTRELRRLLASRLFSRAIASSNRVRLQEWVAVGCPGKFWSDTAEEEGAWRRSLAEPDLTMGTTSQTPEETIRRLRELAAQVAKATVRGNDSAEGLSLELIKLEATADPFLRPAIFRYRQALKAGGAEGDLKEKEEALNEADVSVERWRKMREKAEELLDWYELNVPDARLGPALMDWEKTIRVSQDKNKGRPTGLEPATARITIWSSTN